MLRRLRHAVPAAALALALLPATVESQSTEQRASSPFHGNVMWLWQLPNSHGGDPVRIAQRARRSRMNTIIIKATDGSTPFRGQFTRRVVRALKARGLKVCGYSYVYGNNPSREADMGALVKRTGADCLVIDAEQEYEGKYAAASAYVRRLRALVGGRYPVALAPFPYVDYHRSFPYSVFLGPGAAQYTLPQMYWRDIGTTVDEVFRRTYLYTRIYGRPIFPIGQLYMDPPRAQIIRFRQLAEAYGAPGVSWWVWEHANDAEWEAVGTALAPLAAPFTPSQEWPVLRRGARGDPVIWLQQHLAGAGQALAVTGAFDAATDTALRAVQAGAGLPATGATDAATWDAVLRARPQIVDWRARSRPARAAAAGRPGAELSAKPGG